MPINQQCPYLGLNQHFKVPLTSEDLLFAQIPSADEEEEAEEEVQEQMEEEEVEEEQNEVEEEEEEMEEVEEEEVEEDEEYEDEEEMEEEEEEEEEKEEAEEEKLEGNAEEERPLAEILCVARMIQSTYSSISWSKLHEEFSHQEEEDSSFIFQMTEDSESLKILQNQKVNKLVNFLILKYRKKESITQVEMLKVITKAWEKQFPVILEGACKCLEMICGIIMKESDPISSSYVLVNSLNLSYQDIDDKRMPINGLLILILGVIFIDGDTASEESIWEFLNSMGIHDGEEHFLYGEPRKLLTKEMVQEKYLEYQQVPNSHPPRFKFLWGPRAHTEASKMKVLKHLGRVTMRDPKSFSFLYGEAIRDEERARARVRARLGLMASTGATPIDNLLMASASQDEELVYSVFEESSKHSQ